MQLTATVAALLPEERPEPSVTGFDYDLAPNDPSVLNEGGHDDPSAWHLEWARIGDSRTVEVEIVVNGHPVATRTILADGSEQQIALELELERSSRGADTFYLYVR